MKKFYVYNDWTSEYIRVYDRKSATKIANRIIKDWMYEMGVKDYEVEEDRGGSGVLKMVSSIDKKLNLIVEICEFPDLRGVKKEYILHWDEAEVAAFLSK